MKACFHFPRLKLHIIFARSIYLHTTKKAGLSAGFFWMFRAWLVWQILKFCVPGVE